MRPSNEGGAVLTGTSGSLLLHPSEFIESRKEAEAMLGTGAIKNHSYNLGIAIDGGQPGRARDASASVPAVEGVRRLADTCLGQRSFQGSRSRRHGDMDAEERCGVAWARRGRALGWLLGARRERVHSSGLFNSVQLQLLRARNGGFRADDLPGVCEGAIQWQMSDRRLRYGDGCARLVTRRGLGWVLGLLSVEAQGALIGRAWGGQQVGRRAARTGRRGGRGGLLVLYTALALGR